MKKKLVVLTGAGVSADSGLKTFRDGDGLWEGYRVEDVATPEAWRRDPALVLKFYNERRRALLHAEPNAAHLALAELENTFAVTIITQNVDNLHERAGSTHVIHLHGELTKSQSTYDPSLVYEIVGPELNLGDRCEKGSQLRPFIVWFGEAVPAMETALTAARQAEIFIVVGTSLVVYPAAGLVDFAPADCPVYVVDPKRPPIFGRRSVDFITERAAVGMPLLAERLCAASND